MVVRLCPLQYYIEYRVQYLYFKPRMSRSKWKISSGVAGTIVLFIVLYCKIKNVFFDFVFVCLCIICGKSIINPHQYSTNI